MYILALWAFWHVDICLYGCFIKGIFWHQDIMELGHFNKGIFQICGLFDMGTLKHRDVSAQRYFGNMEVLAQDRTLRQSAKISLLRI